MAEPCLYGDLILINNADTTTGWNNRAGNYAPSQNTENFKAGSASIAVEPKKIQTVTIAYDATSVDFTNQYFFCWLWALGKGFFDSRSNGGIRIYAEDTSGNTAYWYVAGYDTAWVGQGWKRLIVDLNRSPDSSSGWSGTSVANVQWLGFSLNYLSYTSKTPLVAIDQLHRGNILEITGGTASDPVTFQNVYEWDQGIMAGSTGATATGNNFYGFVSLNQSGSYELLGNIRIGREIAGTTGASGTYFESSNEVILWQDNPTATGANVLSFGESGAGVSTNVTFGTSVGSGADQRGYGGSVMYAITDVFSYGYELDFSNPIDTCQIYGSSFFQAYEGVTIAVSSDHEYISDSFVDCDQVAGGSATIRQCIFSETNAGGTAAGGGTGAALLWNDDINISYCKFLANSDGTTGTSGPYAIEHSATGSYDYNNMVFQGNDHDIYCSVSSDTLLINATESNPSTYHTAGATVDIQNTVYVTVRNVTSRRESVSEYARCYVETLSGGPESAGVEILRAEADTADDLNSGRYKAVTSYNYQGSNQPVLVRARYKGFTPFLATSVITDDGMDVSAVWIRDTIIDI
jgi:hypothetical protein